MSVRHKNHVGLILGQDVQGIVVPQDQSGQEVHTVAQVLKLLELGIGSVRTLPLRAPALAPALAPVG